MENRDERLWQMAQKRAAFKKNLYAYAIIIPFLWLLWAINGAKHYGGGVPWPVWPMLGWGIGLAFHYFDAYQAAGKSLEEREYERLKGKQ